MIDVEFFLLLYFFALCIMKKSKTFFEVFRRKNSFKKIVLLEKHN